MEITWYRERKREGERGSKSESEVITYKQTDRRTNGQADRQKR
jgi:hypothetical protein